MSFKIGVDVGGTFTDLSLYSQDGALQTFKTLSTPDDPSIGVLDGLQLIAEAKGLTVEALAEQTATIVHGTTVTTNAVLTRGGAKCGLLTTKGVRDALEMRRGIRERQYDNRYPNVVPLVPRRLRLPIDERLDFRGEPIAHLPAQEVREAAELLKGEGVEAVAICFMNAFANPAHERAAAEIAREVLGSVHLSVSSQVLPTIRFYDRVSTTVLDAYVGPVLKRYLEALTGRLSSIGFAGVLLIMQSSGGVASPESTASQPAMTLLSGPAAGPRAAASYARALDSEDCTVVDMGGTSFDASLVEKGAAALNKEGDIERLRIALPMLEITTIGAGGGSVGWLDEGGLLRMGPESAGAQPGPACYGRGGEKPTCTDADLVLGYLDPERFAGGKLKLDVERARDAIRVHLAEPLGLDLIEAAAGMYRVINSNMAHGVREITVKRGLDPREFPMVVAGGAGALHACMIGSELQIPTLLVPPTASTLCATGMLLCDLQHDYVRSRIGPLSMIEPTELRALVDEMAAAGRSQLEGEGAADCELHVSLDLRYLKQYHEVTVPIALADLERGDIAALAEAFHSEHDRLYGYQLEDEEVDLELINVRVRALGRTEQPSLGALATGSAEPPSVARQGERQAYVPERGKLEPVAVYDGHALLAGNQIVGPALIERVDTTIFVSAGYDATVDSVGSVVLRSNEQGGKS